MNSNQLKEHLFYFADAATYDDEVKDILRERLACGRSKSILEDIEYISSYLNSKPDKHALRRFVAYEMNRDFNDPTGEKDLQWLVGARDLMQSVLDEAETTSSS